MNGVRWQLHESLGGRRVVERGSFGTLHEAVADLVAVLTARGANWPAFGCWSICEVRP